ncbi:molybdopterin synthase catalytic subunit MoaE [Oceanospirillum sediminis]|uniref:Molybdopterin synthase catalytic subunit n=1 Tax=Oceanospirillum sediminis TaxID=2760088 RepID=A0A839IWB2_9GAMM|nr:molybdopterin synthase catalytic subunit MoaE [Oceanospirillum sediminis]MBB1489052.1 molybdopterin synthase catalytic subunit MoaE [Oceanospirillum sediminis]
MSAFSVSVQAENFDIGTISAEITHERTDIGAIVSFTGLVRDFNEKPDVTALTLEHYPGMTEASLMQIIDQARTRWPLQDVRVIHRVGRLEPGDPIVLVVTASAHRLAAFDACAFIMDYLKTQAPFWKKENTLHGDYWVSARESDQNAAARWGLDNKENSHESS